MTTPRSGAALLPDGITLRYKLYGDPISARRRIVLVHSLAMAGDVWSDVAERLAVDSAVLTYDCRGHGASSRPEGPYRLEIFAADLAGLLDTLGWHRIHLAGASMGGNVSLQFAALFPHRVHTLGLVDTTAWYGAEAAAKWDQRARQAEEQGLASLLRFQETRWFSDAFREQNGAAVQRCAAIFLANDPHAFASTCRMLGAFDLRGALPALTMPATIVVGEEDYATPLSMAQELQSGMPGTPPLQIIPKVRHLTFAECPEIVTRALSELHHRVPGNA
jgi:3-oxoadipate enol-lactonase